MKEKLVWGVFVVLVACVVAALIGWWLRREDPRRLPDFRLVERSGRPIARRDLLGDVWVADFIFTQCPGACPRMLSRMYGLQQRVPEARYVSITCDPEHDTPEVLAKHVAVNLPGIIADRWHFLTGPWPQIQDLAVNGFKVPLPAQRDHGEHFVLVDRHGRVRGYCRSDDAGDMENLERNLKAILAEPALPVKKLPAVNAGLNGVSAILLIAGLVFIKLKRIGAHKACMLAALVSSTIFLVSYLTAHYYLGSMPYAGQGWRRPLYFSILISHTILAAFIVPLAAITLYRAFRGQFVQHRAVARYTLPIWLYVSVTGVVIYFMLYG